MSQLTDLSLLFNQKSPDNYLSHLPTFSSLQKLSVDARVSISTLHLLTSLTGLSLFNSPCGQYCFNTPGELNTLTHLRALSLTFMSVIKNEHIQCLTNLEALSTKGKTGLDAKNFPHFPSLTTLSVYNTHREGSLSLDCLKSINPLLKCLRIDSATANLDDNSEEFCKEFNQLRSLGVFLSTKNWDSLRPSERTRLYSLESTSSEPFTRDQICAFLHDQKQFREKNQYH